MINHPKTEMIKNLDSLLKSRLIGKTALLFGHCNATEEMADYLLSQNVNPAAILDNSTAKQGSAYRDIPVVSPELIKNYNADTGIILIASRFFSEMSEQCRQLGYNGEIIKAAEYDSFTEFSVSDETVKNKTERMRRGAKRLEQIRKKYPAEHLVICPNNALGDVYWAMSFLPAYCEKNAVNETAAAVIGESCRQVAKMFNARNLITLGNTEMDELVQAIIFTREKNCIIAHHDRPYTDNIIKWLNKRFLSFIDYYKYAVYGLNTPPVQPTRFEKFDNQIQIPKEKSVILSPFAKSVVKLPTEFWENIVKEYSAKGFAVYTNVIGEEEAVKGTLPLSVSISQMPAAAEYAGTFIGLRNGLCDVLHTANCRKIVVFPDCYYSATPHKVSDFFALPNWETVIYNGFVTPE